MNILVKCLVIGAFTATTTLTTIAQPGMGPGMGGPPGVDPIMTKFFGDVKAFSATAEMTATGGGENMSVPMEFALLDGKVRTELDLAQAKSAKMPPGTGEQLKQIGMDKMVNIVDPQKKVILMIYPGLSAYAETPMPKEQAEMAEKEPKMEKTDLGKETVEGHPCKKCKVTITGENGKKHDATIWNATDLKDFPIKLQTKEQGMDMVILYKNIKFEKPDAKRFEVPKDYTKYENLQALIQGAVMKRMMANPPQ